MLFDFSLAEGGEAGGSEGDDPCQRNQRDFGDGDVIAPAAQRIHIRAKGEVRHDLFHRIAEQ